MTRRALYDLLIGASWFCAVVLALCLATGYSRAGEAYPLAAEAVHGEALWPLFGYPSPRSIFQLSQRGFVQFNCNFQELFFRAFGTGSPEDF